MKRSESKYFNTALCMDEALIALLEKKDLEYITVKEICAKAGVNRSTFYLHYETVSDLLEEAMEGVNQRFQSYFVQSAGDFVGKIGEADTADLVLVTRAYLIPYLQFIKDNKRIYRATFRNPRETQGEARLRHLQQHIFEPILRRFQVPEKAWRYYIAYYIEGIMAIIREWLKNNCRDPIETLSAVIEECVRPFDHAGGPLHEP